MSLGSQRFPRLERFLLVAGLAVAGLTGCTQTRLEPLELPAWVTVVQHLELELIQDAPEYQFALSCTAEERDGPLNYSAITITVRDEQNQNAVTLPQPDVDCATSKGMVVSTGVLSLPPNIQAGDVVHIRLEAHTGGVERSKAGREYVLGEDGQLYHVYRKH